MGKAEFFCKTVFNVPVSGPALHNRIYNSCAYGPSNFRISSHARDKHHCYVHDNNNYTKAYPFLQLYMEGKEGAVYDKSNTRTAKTIVSCFLKIETLENSDELP